MKREVTLQQISLRDFILLAKELERAIPDLLRACGPSVYDISVYDAIIERKNLKEQKEKKKE